MLFIGGYINMANQNSLIALAYIKEMDNPLEVFCNYIRICLQITPGNSLKHDELAGKITEQFGLKMPHHMIKMCCRILEKEKKIEKIPQGAGYLLKDFSFDLNAFEVKKEQLQFKERLLVNGLISCAEDYNIQWDYPQAREHLTNFLLVRGNAVSIFSSKTVEVIEREKYIPNEWYVGKYISHLLECNDDRTDYLIDIINGLMIYIGIYETADYNQDKGQKFRGTNFYFDTKLILRLLGYSWNLEVEATKELADLIVKEYGGNICLFDHTIGEIQYALNTAADSIKRGEIITDYELRTYVELNKCTDYDLKLYAQTAKDTIEKKLGLKIQPTIEWGNEKNQRYNLDVEKIKQFVKERHSKWKDKAIGNDVDAINYINILRKGDYSIKYGGRRKLPVFITSNTALVWDIKEYINQFWEDDKEIATWNINALPIITDNMLMCRLWLPKAQHLVSIPALTLARNAYAAQQTNIAFFEKIRASAMDLREKHDIDIINVSVVRKEKLEELIVKNTHGNIEEITPEMVATTVDELVNQKTSELKESVDSLEKDNENKALIIKKQEENTICSAAERYKNKLGVGRIVIYLAKWYWVVIAIAFGLLSLGLSALKGMQWLQGFSWFGIIYVFLFIVLKLLEKIANRRSVEEFLISKATKFTWSRYADKVRSGLLDFEKNKEREILLACIELSPILCQYRRYCNLEQGSL